MDGLLEKKCEFFQIAKGSKFAVECDWNSKISQSIQNLGSSKVNRWASWKKSEFVQNLPQLANLP